LSSFVRPWRTFSPNGKHYYGDSYSGPTAVSPGRLGRPWNGQAIDLEGAETSARHRGSAMHIRDGFNETVGNTALIRLGRLSVETGRTVLGSAEFWSLRGSVKDRAALKPGATMVEGTADIAGIGLAHLCAERDRRRSFRTPSGRTSSTPSSIGRRNTKRPGPTLARKCNLDRCFYVPH
jgi:hypothetical protein